MKRRALDPLFGVLILSTVLVALGPGDCFGQQRVTEKSLMLIVTKLLPPRGPDKSSEFTNVCFQKLESLFDTTSIQVVALRSGQTIEKISRHKKDIILISDPSDFFSRGRDADTLVFWMHYKVGFAQVRTLVPFTPGLTGDLPDRAAREIYKSATSDLLGKIALSGGPPGLEMKIDHEISVRPPSEFLVAAGEHSVMSTFPGFAGREDSIAVYPGQTTQKRILLLPEE